ncbi:flavin reductase family protein [Nitratiruptor sp. YY09-18]|uniref:flavin reductase family protein n=1 Tax=Nitratiruptor sp. YY09-18 TaxID=2724901 RepID=UPI001916B6ED|nr:flavin reductase family protein [Nitratiruptor sp. YY09-18]BCD68835.1 hypothetical protein NitYY0918_C1754 [Nitratiruptor sp. YY09-18]
MIIDFDTLELKDRYKIMSRTIIPRPIAWIVTEGKSLNIAPFSYFMALSSEPPTLIVSIGHKKNRDPKDTLANIRSQKRCTICFVTPEQITKMHQSSEPLPSEVSEASHFGIATTKILKDFPPVIDDSPAAFFCTLHQEIELGGKTIPLILKIEEYYIKDELFDKNYDFDFHFVARVGKEYRLCDKVIEP